MRGAIDATIRLATPDDEPFLWQMLYHAATMGDDGASSGDEAKGHPYLAKYVRGWGRDGDLGTIAVESGGAPVGAAWLRRLVGAEKNYPAIDDGVPELAIAVRPECVGRGIGERLLARLFEAARPLYPAIVLSVRKPNPARRLYERLGFAVVDVVVNRVGGRSLVMLKPLAETKDPT